MKNIKLKNKKQDSYLKKQILEGEFAPFMLFVGQEGTGKKGSALALASAILCSNENGEPCQICANCKLLNSNNHPDLIRLGGEGTIKIAEVRQFQKLLFLKPYKANHKVAIVQDAHFMTEESANALLKILEEPPKSTVIILITPDKNMLPETIISRGQVVSFGATNSPESAINKEVLEDVDLLLRKLENNIYERFSMVYKYAKDREEAQILLDALEKTLRKKLVDDRGTETKNIEMLEKVQNSREYLRRNLSGKFVLENLIINM